MKFGGTSLADAERILRVAETVRVRMARQPVVVVSALGDATDVLVHAVTAACSGDGDRLQSILSGLERQHRWALAGGVEDARRRHDLNLEIDGLFEDLRERLRSIRILGEGSPRAVDGLLAFGEALSARIVAGVFRDRGLPARVIDPVDVMVTDARHGAAQPIPEAVKQCAADRLVTALATGDLPVIGGFVGATPDGVTTTLGRGGSDTSAAIIGSALDAEEIQIWTDVDGLMSADPRLVANARPLDRLSFSEAAELAFYGARVLHPASIAPAVRQNIPVRILNSLRPEAPGTVILDESPSPERGLASVASRTGIHCVRVRHRAPHADPGLLSRVLDALRTEGQLPELVVASEAAVHLALSGEICGDRLRRALGPQVVVEIRKERAIVCVVGSGLCKDRARSGRVLAALGEWQPELVAYGASENSIVGVVREADLEAVVRGLHGRFLEEETQV